MQTKAQRKARSTARQEAYNKLTLDQKIEKAKKQRGNSEKQLKRLLAMKKVGNQDQIAPTDPKKDDL